jgi:hypothetical protein
MEFVARPSDSSVRVDFRAASPHNIPLRIENSPTGYPPAMKTKTKHRKGHKWRKKADSSPIAKGRRPKRHGRNPKKRKHLGGRGL